MRLISTKVLFLFALILFAVASPLRAQPFKEAVDYNDYIVDQQNSIGRELITFNEAFADETVTFESITPTYNQLIKVTETAIANVTAMDAYGGNTDLRNSAAALFGFYLDIFKNEYLEMMKILLQDEATESGFARVEEIMQQISASEAEFDQAFNDAQTAFAEKHNFKLEENELTKEFEGEEGDE